MADPQKASLRDRLGEELRRYALVSLYLWIVLGAIFAYKSAVLSEAGLPLLPLGTALVKALVLGKFVLIGEAARVGDRARTGTVLGRVLWKSVAFLVFLVVLTILEELLVGWFHGRTALQVLGELGGSPLALVASSILMLLVLLPFFMAQELARVLGPGALRRILTGSPDELRVELSMQVDGVSQAQPRAVVGRPTGDPE